MEKNKKSLLVTLDFPPDYGGVASYYYQLAKNLPADKIVVLAPEKGDTKSFDLQQRFTIIRSKTLAEIAESKGGLLNLNSKLKWLKLSDEIKILAKNHQFKTLLIGQVLPLGHIGLMLRNKFSFIFFAHGMDITVPAKNIRKKILLKKIIKKATKIIANSYFTRHELFLLGADKEKITVINPCPNLNAEHVNEEIVKKFLHENDLAEKKIILTVGRLVKRKGHDQIIKAMPQILKKIPNAFYLIAGAGPYKPELENLISKNKLGAFVKFINKPESNLLPTLYQACEVMAMPARSLGNGDVEGFGIVYLEANTFGKPVVGGKSGGVPEAVVNEKTGLLVDPQNTEEIAQAIISLLIDEAYANRLGLQGMDRVHEEFNWSTQAKKLFETI